MKKLLFAILFVMPVFSWADSTLFGGQPRITFEYEHEKNTHDYGSTPNNAVSIFPGIQWKGDARPLGFITRAELMLEGNQDHGNLGSSGVGRTTETKMGVRVRSDGEIAGRWGYYVRGLVGQSWNNEQNFAYWYIEPALKTDFGDVVKGAVADCSDFVRICLINEFACICNDAVGHGERWHKVRVDIAEQSLTVGAKKCCVCIGAVRWSNYHVGT